MRYSPLRLMKPCLIFFFVLRITMCADTLTLRNGTTVTGSWLSADADKIQFLADDKTQAYMKSDVVHVTFGAAGAAPARPQAPKVVYGPEPEWYGAVYLRDASGMFIPLEKNHAGDAANRTCRRLYKSLESDGGRGFQIPGANQGKREDGVRSAISQRG